MGFFEIIQTFFTEHIIPLSWRDLLEIIFFSSSFYYVIRWLANDRQKKLLHYFFSGSAFIIFSYLFELRSITSFLCAYSAPLIMLVILVHQRTLQKNFIGLKKLEAPKPKLDYQWIEVMIRVMLRAISNNRPISCIIEQTERLDDLLKPALPISCPLTLATLSSLVESNLFDSAQMVWADNDGSIRGLNATINQHDRSKEDHETSRYLDALFLSSTTDALIITADPDSRSFTVMATGKATSQLNAEQAQRILKTLINSTKKGDLSHADFTYAQKPTGKQPHL